MDESDRGVIAETSNTLLPKPKRAKRQAIRAALSTLNYRVGQGQVNGYSFRLVIQAGGAKC